MKSAVNIVKIGTSIILKVFINFITNKEVHMMTFCEPPYKEVYLNNVVWLPDTTLRIMIIFKIVLNFPFAIFANFLYKIY
jgi:hypothetical protein